MKICNSRIPPPASLVPLVLSGPLCPAGISPPRGESPLSGEAILKRLHQKTPEYQRHKYRQGQQSALASPRRTARNERTPPNGFDTTAPETTLHRRTPTPPETKTFHLPAATGTAGGMPVPASRQTPASGQRLCSVRSFRQRCRLPDLWRR